MFRKKTIEDVEINGKKVLVRVDFNVPLEGEQIADDTRIRAALPTINYLLDGGAGVILMSHLGRPGGKTKREFSLKPVAEYLDGKLENKVTFVPDCMGKEAESSSADLKPGEVLLLENTRFHPGEKKNDPKMAEKLASLGELFVNDAFGTAHRSHASNVGVTNFLPAVAGFLLEKEIIYLDKTIKNPERPFVAVLGGAKISGKIGVISNLLSRVDQILIGGGMANTFFKAKGYQLGDSLVENEVLDTAKDLLKKAGDKIVLPVDVVIADEFSADAQKKTIDTGDVSAGWQILDVGPETIKLFRAYLADAGTIVWNGPMGVFEFPAFAEGTFSIARAVADSSAVSIIGGGDSASAVSKAGLTEKITHVSTGGGASLQMLEGENLPGLDALDDQEQGKHR
ncbi:MAG: phosphoglycerate kinase [Anaerolineales bacterium]|nr:phosphoglycerate kinase [Anaerolineales bacterium]